MIQKRGSVLSGNLGWEALDRIWNVGPSSLDHAVLSTLITKPARAQEHILLSLAAIDLSNVKNLSAYLNCLVREHDGTRQVCLYFLAGLCTEEKCTWVHPVNTRGWNALRDNWNVTYKVMDYTVLNFLCKKNIDEQDEILVSLANLNLRGINNLSAYLSSMIQKHGNFQQSPGLMMGAKRNEGKRDNRPQAGRQGYAAPRAYPQPFEVPQPYVGPQYIAPQSQSPGLMPLPVVGAPGMLGTVPFYSPAFVPQQRFGALSVPHGVPIAVGNPGCMDRRKGH